MKSVACDALVDDGYEYDIGRFVNKHIDDYTKRKMLESPWQPSTSYKLPFSLHNKKGKFEKRYLNQSHLQQYPWLVYPHVKKGLFCKYCPFFVTSHSGGFQKTVPLEQLVTRPLVKFAKLLGKNGDLENHCRNRYHTAAVEAGNSFVAACHNPVLEVINQVSSQRLGQVRENRERLIPIVKTVIFLGRQNIPFRGHRDDGPLLCDKNAMDEHKNEGNFRELLRFRIEAGDHALGNQMKNVNSRATYISKKTQNELIECCGYEMQRIVLERVKVAKYYNILFDETTDLSHTSQMSAICP